MSGRVCSWNEQIKRNHWTKKSKEEIQEIVNKIQQNGTITNTKEDGFIHLK